MLTSNWIMTIFCGYLPGKVLIPFLDNFFREGWTALYRFSLTLLTLWEDQFLQLDDIAFISRLVHTLRDDFNFDRTVIFTMAYSAEISMLFGKNYEHVVSLEQQYFTNQVQTKLG